MKIMIGIFIFLLIRGLVAFYNLSRGNQ